MAKRVGSKKRGQKGSYGIGEWYGHAYTSLSQAERLAHLKWHQNSVECRFLVDMPDLAPRNRTNCNKIGGVCSIRSFELEQTGSVTFGPITATCPHRFLEGGTVFNEIARVILGTDSALFAKEIPFLIRPQNAVLGGDSLRKCLSFNCLKTKM
jgi:hypothetical protein